MHVERSLPVVLLDPALAPSQNTVGDAGIDLRASAPATLGARTGPVTVGTGVAVAIPDGHAGLVCSRSGLASQLGIAVLNGPGIIDAGYRGEIQVILFGIRQAPHTLERGTRVAQLVVVPISDFRLEFMEALPPTPRGSRGLGSSGR